MDAVLDLLPEWVATAALPAVSVVAFFWKGDDALSQDFKQWLSQKILRMRLTVPEISSIEPLGKVFDLIFGPQYLGLTTFLRVAAVSFAASLISIFAMLGIRESISLLSEFIEDPITFVAVITVNIFFDYLSITKSRIAIARIAKFNRKYALSIFVCVDFALTSIIVFVYFFTMLAVLDFIGAYVDHAYMAAVLSHLIVYFSTTVALLAMIGTDLISVLSALASVGAVTFLSFLFTTFITLLLMALYSISLMLLMFLNLAAKTTYMRWIVPENILPILRWILPIETFPVRSIGMVAGMFVFLFLGAFRMLT